MFSVLKEFGGELLESFVPPLEMKDPTTFPTAALSSRSKTSKTQSDLDVFDTEYPYGKVVQQTMTGNPFGGMFDFNRDGKTDSFEMATRLFMLSELEKSARQKESEFSVSGGFGDDDGEDEDDEDDLSASAPVDPLDLSLGNLDGFTRPASDPTFNLGSGFDF